MPNKKHVIVIGAGVGGLSAAIYARLAGHEVLVLEAGSKVGGKAAGIEQSGYRFDPGPSIIILTEIYERLFADAGRRIGDYLRFKRLDPISRVYHGGGKPIDLPSDRNECIRTLSEIAPQDVKPFEELLTKLDRVAPQVKRSIFAHPFDQPWQLADPNLIRIGLQFDVRKTYREMIDGWFTSDLLKAFFYGFPSYGGQTYDSKAPGALLIPYLMIQDGVFYPEGGVAAIPLAFERLAKELGVTILLDAKVQELLTDGKRVTGVRQSNGERHEADAVISNVDRITTRSWLGIKPNLRPSFSYFTVQWGIRRRIPGLSHHTLLIPTDFQKGFADLYERRKFPDPPIVYLNETSGADPTADPGTAPPNATNLFAVVTSPSVEPHIDWDAETPKYRSIIVDQIRAAGFEWNEDDIEVERIQTPVYFQQTHGNYLGSLYGPDETQRLFGGMFPLRNWDEEYKNLFYCGGSVQPGAGLPMVTLSGKFAAGAVNGER
jgi:phytoene desaturase